MDKNKKINNAQSYDLICEDWHQFRKSTQINKCIVDFVDYLVPNGKVLDIGCGTGYPIAQYLALRNFEVTGIDISGKMIDVAKKMKLNNAVFINQDIMNFSTETKYDGVIAFDSIWHIAKKEQSSIYYKVASLMKDGAYFIFTHGNHNGETIGTMFNQQFYYSALSVDELKAELSRNGLKIISLIEDYKEPSTGERDLLVIAQKRNSFEAI